MTKLTSNSARPAEAPAAGAGVPARPPRPRVETPAASARAAAAAAARLAARRQRDALPVKIETARLVLRAPIRGDVPDIARLADNPAIHAMLPLLPAPYTRADAIAFVEIFSLRGDERPYAVTLAGQCIGIVGFSYVAGGAAPELGYWLGEPYRGKGYMSEAVKALLEAAFTTGTYPRIRARALAGNAASLRVLDKAGFRQVRDATGARGPGADESILVLEVEQPRWM